MAAAGLDFSGKASTAAAKATRHIVPDVLDSGATSSSFFEFRGDKCANGAKLVAKKAAQEQMVVVKHQLNVVNHSKMQREDSKKKTAGNKWFDMQSDDLTPEVRRDFALLKMRNYLDPKKFYKVETRLLFFSRKCWRPH